MKKKRLQRLNSLLKEVLSEVIREDVKNPHVSQLLSVTRVEITPDLHFAKVYISVIGSEKEKEETIIALTSAAGFIATQAAKKVVMRYFPSLTFKLDESVDAHMNIEKILKKIHEEQSSRKPNPDSSP